MGLGPTAYGEGLEARRKQLKGAAYQYIFDDDDTAEMPFAWICEVLDLDLDWIRTKIKEGELEEWKQQYVNQENLEGFWLCLRANGAKKSRTGLPLSPT